MESHGTTETGGGGGYTLPKEQQQRLLRRQRPLRSQHIKSSPTSDSDNTQTVTRLQDLQQNVSRDHHQRTQAMQEQPGMQEQQAHLPELMANPGQRNTKDSEAYLMSVLQALRNKQNSEGSAGISSLISNIEAEPSVSRSSTPNTADMLGCYSDPANIKDTTSGNITNLGASHHDTSTEHETSSKRRKAYYDYSEDDANSDTYSNCGSSSASKLGTASNYIAQLSCDITSINNNNHLHSASPSSSSCSSSQSAAAASPSHFSSSMHRSLKQKQLDWDLPAGSSARTEDRLQTKGSSSSLSRAPPPPVSTLPMEDSIFARAHSAMLQGLQQTPSRPTRRGNANAVQPKTKRKQLRKKFSTSSNRCNNNDDDENSSSSSNSLEKTLDERPASSAVGPSSDDELSRNQQQSTTSGTAANRGAEDGTSHEDGSSMSDKSPADGGDGSSSAILDTSGMTVEEVLQYIKVPKLTQHLAHKDLIREFLDQHEIGHLNHLIKCFTDAIFTVSMPESIVGKSNILPVDFLDAYCCCVLRVHFLLFKNLDFMNLLLSDQVSLLQCGVLKALLCMSFFVFKEETNSWHIPTSVNEMNHVVIKMSDLNQILPHNLLQQTLAINVTSTKLKFDWPMGMLCICAFFYSPIDIQVQQINKIDKLRDRYIEILLKYLKWKHGPYNASVIFPEILKLMDAILKHCKKVENLTLRLKEEEVEAFEKRLNSLNANTNMDTKAFLNLDCDDSLHTGVTFAKINRRISMSVQFNLSNTLLGNSVELRHCAAVPTASMYYSNLPQESEEAKSRREVEALLIQRLLQSNQAQNGSNQVPPDEDSVSGGKQGECDQRTQPSSAAIQAPRPALPTSNMNVFAIQRLLLDIARKEQLPTSPETLAMSPSRTDDAAADPASNSHLGHHTLTPGSLPLHALQQKLYHANVLTAALTQQQQHAHLANFAKSLGYRAATSKPSGQLPPADKGGFRVSTPHADDSNIAIDLSRHRCQTSSIPSNTTIVTSSHAGASHSSLPKIPDLKPLSEYKSSLPVKTSPPPRQSPPQLAANDGREGTIGSVSNRGACQSTNTSDILSAIRNKTCANGAPAARDGEVNVPASATKTSVLLMHPSSSFSSSSSTPANSSSQLTARHLEMLLESLGQSKYSQEDDL